MKATDLKILVKSRLQSKIARALHIAGSPGLGKTQIPAQVAKELGIGFKAIHAPLLQPEDYGFPVVNKETKDVSFVVSKEKFPLEGSDCEDSGILLIDELPQADANAQKILANLLQEREIHGQKLKPGWTVITTGNRTTDRAGANRLLSHLANKITQVTLEPSIDDWTVWALKNSIKLEVISFLRFRPDLLNTFDPHTEVNATPRAWCEGVSASLGAVPAELEFETFKGDVGEGPAAEFIATLNLIRKLPSFESILLNPDKAMMPTESSVLYALSCGLALKVTPNNFTTALKYINRIPSELAKAKREGGQEFIALFVRQAVDACPEIQETKDFIAWASGDGAKLLL